jgi:hypothetical protein
MKKSKRIFYPTQTNRVEKVSKVQKSLEGLRSHQAQGKDAKKI